MGEHKKIEVGDKFTLKCGVVVSVSQYNSSENVVITDGIIFKKTTSYLLRSGSISWIVDGKRLAYRSPSRAPHGQGKNYGKIKLAKKYKLGGTYSTDSCGDVKIIDVSNGNVTVEFLNTSHISVYKAASFRSSTLKDSTLIQTKTQKSWPIGTVIESKKHGRYKITECLNSEDITILWEESGKLQKVDVSQLKINSVRDLTRCGNYLQAKGHYVYYATAEGQIVYIGKGKGNRYAHCCGGKSTSFTLNKLYFEGISVVVSLVCDKMSDCESQIVERFLIEAVKPRGNTRIPSEDLLSLWEILSNSVVDDRIIEIKQEMIKNNFPAESLFQKP